MSAAGLPSLEEGIKSPHVPEEYEHANMELKREETSPVASNTTDHVSRSNDPMQWSWLQKHSILACVSLLGGLGTYAGLFIVPAYGLMSKQFHTSITRVSYQVGIYVLVLGAAPLFWNPFAQTHGRRPVVSCAPKLAMSKSLRSNHLGDHLRLLGTVYRFNGNCTSRRNLGLLCALVWYLGRRQGCSGFRSKCCTCIRWSDRRGHIPT